MPRHSCSALLLLLTVMLAGCRPAAQTATAQTASPANPVPADYTRRYPWPRVEAAYQALVERTPAPPGFTRVPLIDGRWGHWLRYLPVRAAGTPVRTVAGEVTVAGGEDCLAAVIDLDVRRNQDCADVIIRLLAEYLRYKGRPDSLVFAVNDGSKIAWKDWKRGVRPRMSSGRLRYARTAGPDASRASFDRYLATVFAWCGTVSLPLQTSPVPPGDLQVGDILTRAGSPGHAVLIADLAKDAQGNRQALILQGYLPAQSAHVVKPPGEWAWIGLDPSQPVEVPRWGPFEWRDLRRFVYPKP